LQHATAIDRLVHHSIILEFDGASQRVKKSQNQPPAGHADHGAVAPNPADRTAARPRLFPS
jgi:hypothetical protein